MTSKTKLNHRRSAQAKRKLPSKPTQTAAPNPECGYRPGTLYSTLFMEGNKDYIEKSELIKQVAEKTGKSEKVVGFAFQVLKSPSHRSNKNRSAILEENGKIKLIPIRKSHL